MTTVKSIVRTLLEGMQPGISLSELARQFDGISKPVLIKLLREEGLI